MLMPVGTTIAAIRRTHQFTGSLVSAVLTRVGVRSGRGMVHIATRRGCHLRVRGMPRRRGEVCSCFGRT